MHLAPSGQKAQGGGENMNHVIFTLLKVSH